MADSGARQRKRRTVLRKLSRHEREARVDAGELNPELDFVCPYCKGIYSIYCGRDKIHLRACKRRIAQATKAPEKPPLPSPPPFESEVFPAPTTGELAIKSNGRPPLIRSHLRSRPGCQCRRSLRRDHLGAQQ